MYVYHSEPLGDGGTLRFYRKQFHPLVHPVLVQTGRLRSRKRHTIPVHRHKAHEFLWVRRGTYACRLNGTALSLGRGDILILAPGDSHQDFLRPGLDLLSLYFEFQSEHRVALPRLSLLREGLPARAHVVRGGALLSLMETRLQHPPDRIFQEAVLESLAGAWFWSLVELLPRRALSEAFTALLARQEFSERLLAYFRGQVHALPRVVEMAGALGMGESAFAHACTKALGHSPRVLLEQAKMREAVRLLAETTETIEAIARRLGYANPFHFSRAFKKVMGKAPTQYRAARP